MLKKTALSTALFFGVLALFPAQVLADVATARGDQPTLEKPVAENTGIVLAKTKARPRPHKEAKAKIIYRVISNKQAYSQESNEPHLAIKVTPPAVMGPNESVAVEVYNYTQMELADVEFDITLANNEGYDLTTKVNAGALTAYKHGMNSGIRKIPTPGKGPFPPILKVRVYNLRVVNADATRVEVPTYVDLIRVRN